MRCRTSGGSFEKLYVNQRCILGNDCLRGRPGLPDNLASTNFEVRASLQQKSWFRGLLIRKRQRHVMLYECRLVMREVGPEQVAKLVQFRKARVASPNLITG